MTNQALNEVVALKQANIVLDRDFSFYVEEKIETPAAVLTLDDLYDLFDSLFYLIPNDKLKDMLDKIASKLGLQIADEGLMDLLDELTSLRNDSQINIQKLGV